MKPRAQERQRLAAGEMQLLLNQEKVNMNKRYSLE